MKHHSRIARIVAPAVLALLTIGGCQKQDESKDGAREFAPDGEVIRATTDFATAEALRQSEEYARQLEQSAQQTQHFERQLERTDQQLQRNEAVLKRNEEQLQRAEALLKRQEKQADRYDKLLDRWEAEGRPKERQ